MIHTACSFHIKRASGKELQGMDAPKHSGCHPHESTEWIWAPTVTVLYSVALCYSELVILD